LLEFQEALDDFLKATELIEAQDFYLPASFVHYQRGVTRLAMKKYEEAIVDFTQAIDGYEYEGGAAVAPISYYKNRAEAYRGLGLEDKAREDETRTGRLF
jgi:tetratricopeptide (TPR) repeat protein